MAIRWLAGLAPALLAAPLCGCERPSSAKAGQQSVSEPATAAAALRFVDVQDRAGVRFTHSDGGSGRHWFVEQIGAGCAFIDYDNDGLLDIFALSGAPLPGYNGAARPRCELWRNRGNGTFENVTDRSGLGSTDYSAGVCAGDYDNDGFIDLFVTGYGKCRLYHNERNGTFTEVGGHAGVQGDGKISTSACFVDFDNDGLLDLYVCRYVDWDLKHDLWCGKSQTKKSYCGPEVYPHHDDSLFRNNGDGTFTDVSKKAHALNPESKSLGVVAADLNDDGWQDLYVACDLKPNLLYVNQRDGTFREEGVRQNVAFGMDGAAEAGMGVTAGDYDNDGRMDLFVTNYSFEMNALYRNGGSFFSYESQRTDIGPPSLVPLGFGTRFADLDNDGWQDVIVANGHVLDDCAEQNQALTYAQPLMLYMNRAGGATGSRRFDETSAQAGPAFKERFVGRGLAVGDFDNDGRVDFLVNNVNGPLRLIHNESQPIGHWLGLSLKGARCNRSAIGARVMVKTRAGWQVQEVVSGSSYLSQSDLRLHFGLGADSVAEEVRIRWPGHGGRPGAAETWHHLEGSRFHILTEGTAPQGG